MLPLSFRAPHMARYSGEDDVDRGAKLSAEAPLCAQLLELQATGYAVPGVPIVYVVVRGSAYEHEFRRLMKLPVP